MVRCFVNPKTFERQRVCYREVAGPAMARQLSGAFLLEGPTMKTIVISRGEEILARYQPRVRFLPTDSDPGSWNRKKWNRDRLPGGQGASLLLTCLGVVGGWLVVRQPNGILARVIWSDGEYRCDQIISRATQQPVKSATIEELRSGKYQVASAAAIEPWDQESPLGAILR